MISRLCCLVLMLWLTAPAAAETRRALVVGNDSYAEVPELSKAVGDARSVAAALSGIGFETVVVENATRTDMSRQLVEFEGKVEPGDTALFFFAGHGFEIRGDNYLLPIDVPAAREGEAGLVADAAFAAKDIVDRIQSRGARTVILILDACRDNPFDRPGATRALGGTRGLARMEPPEGVFVLFSAGAKQTALDGLDEGDTSPNSVFTRSFLDVLQTPGLSLVQIAKRTQTAVKELAASVSHQQTPAYYDQIVGDFYLTPSGEAEGIAGSAGAQNEPDEDAVAALDAGRTEDDQQRSGSATAAIVPFDLYYSIDRGDNFTTATTQGARDALAAGYFLARTEGYIFAEPAPGTVPLKLFYNIDLADNFTAATAEAERDALAAGYFYVRVEGYLYPAAQPGTAALKLFHGEERGDYFATATAIGETHAIAAGYRYVRVEGYVINAPQ
jgi:hypothetical protein